MFRRLELLGFAIIFIFISSFVLAQSVRAGSVFVFNKNLKTGNVSADVKELQKFLNNNGFFVNKSGLGSLGQETTFFGTATRNALIKFQKANKINPAVGYFGPVSRSVVNKNVESLVTAQTPLSNQVSDKQLVVQANNQPDQSVQDTTKKYFTVGGGITGITGAVILQNNGQDDLTIDIGDNSEFTFATAIEDGANYNVTAKPKFFGQTCFVSDNIGVVSGENIKNIKIACGANLPYNPFIFIPNSGVASYSLTYSAGSGGTISGSTSQTVNSGNSGSAVTAVPDTGYSFVSWSDGVLTAQRTDSSITSNKTVSATFSINSYTVSYDENGSSGGTAPANQTKTHDATLALATNSGTLVKTGYSFSGWNTLDDGTGTDYAVGADYTANVGVTLFAKWTINNYTVSFDTNGGDGGATATQTLVYNTPTVLTTNGFTRTGYTFAGWATTSGGAVEYADGASYTIGANNVTLYAKWNTAIVVGSSYQGGIVAYILQSGDPGYVTGETHGLIAAAANQSSGIIWAKADNQSTAVPGGTSTAIGSGSANTDNIIAQNGLDSTYAAGLARSYTGGDYHDWYLPSLDELTKLYDNRVAIGGFSAAYYWSSFEGDATTARSKHFSVGSISIQAKSTPWTYVRAVRSF